MNPCVKTEGKCNESVTNELKIIRENNSLHEITNESEQIMKQAHRIHVCLIIFAIHNFDVMNSL